MDPIFKKMNFKNQEQILVVNAPDSFRINMEAMMKLTYIEEQIDKLGSCSYLLAFVTQKAEIDQLAPLLHPKMEGDAMLWIAYPKKSSKNYKSDISRDYGWEVVGELGLEPVRLVAIDQDWSALRLRKVEFIKNITRRSSMALTKEAKVRTTNKK